MQTRDAYRLKERRFPDQSASHGFHAVVIIKMLMFALLSAYGSTYHTYAPEETNIFKKDS